MQRIIVPIDFGAASDAALSYARSLASRHDSTVVVVHVLPVTSYGVIYGEVVAIPPALMTRLEGFQEERARKRIEEKLHDFGLDSFRSAIRLMRGDVADAVLEVATIDDFIVLGANQRHLARPGLGEELCRKSPCPILACHASDSPGAATPAFRHGVIAVDGSDLASDVATAASKIVANDGALELVHVIDPSPVHHVGTDMSGAPASPSADAAKATGDTVRAFEDWITDLELGVESSGYIASEPPAQAVLERAVVTEADFIACGAHHGPESAPLGLAEILIRHAPIPVLVVNR